MLLRRKLAACLLAAGLGATAAVPVAAQVPPRAADSASAPAAAAALPWAALGRAQREALAPLAAQWDTLSPPHQRKWLALSNNFSQLPPAEQATLRSRMVEWASLTGQQRSRARLGYAQTQNLAPDERKAQWKAYQALPTDTKRKLAAEAAPQPIGAAPAVKPVSAAKIAVVPIPQGNPANPPRVPTPAAAVRTPSATPGRPATQPPPPNPAAAVPAAQAPALPPMENAAPAP